MPVRKVAGVVLVLGHLLAAGAYAEGRAVIRCEPTAYRDVDGKEKLDLNTFTLEAVVKGDFEAGGFVAVEGEITRSEFRIYRAGSFGAMLSVPPTHLRVRGDYSIGSSRPIESLSLKPVRRGALSELSVIAFYDDYPNNRSSARVNDVLYHSACKVERQ